MVLMYTEMIRGRKCAHYIGMLEEYEQGHGRGKDFYCVSRTQAFQNGHFQGLIPFPPSIPVDGQMFHAPIQYLPACHPEDRGSTVLQSIRTKHSAQCKNPKDNHHLDHCENPQTEVPYSSCTPQQS